MIIDQRFDIAEDFRIPLAGSTCHLVEVIVVRAVIWCCWLSVKHEGYSEKPLDVLLGNKTSVFSAMKQTLIHSICFLSIRFVIGVL